MLSTERTLGFVIFFWILAPILYYTNTWQLSHFPISANEPFDRFGKVYDVTRIMTPDFKFNLTAYDEYSPLYLPATYAVTYLLAFTLSTCVIVHTVLYHGKSLVNGLKNIKSEKDDIHAKLMRNYPEVPDWWYIIAFLFFFCMSIVAAEVWHTGVPVWALLISVALPIIYILPSGFIFAMTGQGVSIFSQWHCKLLTKPVADYSQYSGADHTRSLAPWISVGKHGLQGILCPDPDGGDDVCSGS